MYNNLKDGISDVIAATLYISAPIKSDNHPYRASLPLCPRNPSPTRISEGGRTRKHKSQTSDNTEVCLWSFYKTLLRARSDAFLQSNTARLPMALPVSHLVLLSLTLLAICLLMTHATTSQDTRPHVRRKRNSACAASCANASKMRRCIRMACRKYAMGSLIRFGKRSLESKGLDLTQVSSPSQRQRILEELLLQRAQREYEKQDRQPQLVPVLSQTTDPVFSPAGRLFKEMLLFERQNPTTLHSSDKHSSTRVADSPTPRADFGTGSNGFYQWLEQVLENNRRGQLVVAKPIEISDLDEFTPVKSNGDSTYLQDSHIGDVSTEVDDDTVNTEYTSQHDRQSMGVFSPVNFPDLPITTGDRPSSSEPDIYLNKKHHRRQKGLLRHLIRFG
ncbi:hypothetical protein PoB_001321700 [Plakobranchus ocellatus]|uniref:Uncharacterized protein n=1 Tax=Plakobranchus ocellatus TaxID=259542 RepID=A0AAV3YWJ0_9GAST|nr:hypothetical protein PoB_001321700 [Plakobranchus ocellatus]